MRVIQSVNMSMNMTEESAKVQCWTSLHSHMGSMPRDRSVFGFVELLPEDHRCAINIGNSDLSYASAPVHICCVI